MLYSPAGWLISVCAPLKNQFTVSLLLVHVLKETLKNKNVVLGCAIDILDRKVLFAGVSDPLSDQVPKKANN